MFYVIRRFLSLYVNLFIGLIKSMIMILSISDAIGIIIYV